jgi:hypothetical protein
MIPRDGNILSIHRHSFGFVQSHAKKHFLNGSVCHCRNLKGQFLNFVLILSIRINLPPKPIG